MVTTLITIREVRSPKAPACSSLTDLFYGHEDDGRNEVGRREREDACVRVCFTCPYRLMCLRKALLYNEKMGVWGGMGEGERRRFRAHLRREGYLFEVPDGTEFLASLAAFYSAETDSCVRAAEA